MAETTSQTAALPCQGFGCTARQDAWWAGPLVTALGLGAFVVYTTWAAFQGRDYHWGPYLSPFYSPLIFGQGGHAWFQGTPAWWPDWLPTFSPAFLLLWAPGGFRATCYYYRKAYYRSFFADPPGCAVGEPWNKYKGETAFPWILQNMHRFFFYVAVLFIVCLGYDAVVSYLWTAKDGTRHFGMGLGSLVLTLNVLFLSGYTFGCHSLRHLVGGRLDRFGGVSGDVRHRLWSAVSALNAHHQFWAWLSLSMVGFSDLYVRLVAMGVWTDVRFF